MGGLRSWRTITRAELLDRIYVALAAIGLLILVSPFLVIALGL